MSDQHENPVTWFVKATVTAHIEAQTQADAMQEGEHGAPFDYQVNTVDAERISPSARHG